MSRVLLATGLVVAALGAGCVKNGMGAKVRTDVTDRMESARTPLEACYHAALERNRKLRGQMVLQFRAAPKTGKFEQIEVARDDLRDPVLVECVLGTVGALALTAPQKTSVSITYPLDFAPNK